MKGLILMVLMPLLAAATAQTPPQVSVPTKQLPRLFEAEESKTLHGSIVAYDWSHRYYMEGARVENFIFKTLTANGSGEERPIFLRVVSIWHPADKPHLIPDDFYAADKKWRLTLRATTTFDFLSQYCRETAATATITADVENRKVELRRFVSPSVLPPDAGIPENFKRALANPPTLPDMPDARSMRCMYLEKVTSAKQ